MCVKKSTHSIGEEKERGRKKEALLIGTYEHEFSIFLVFFTF